MVYGDRVVQLGRDGSECELPIEGPVAMVSVAGLRDGRWLSGEHGRLTMRGADGAVQWACQCRNADSIVPRLAPPSR